MGLFQRIALSNAVYHMERLLTKLYDMDAAELALDCDLELANGCDKNKMLLIG